MKFASVLMAVALSGAAVSAQDLPSAFSTGPVIADYGPVAEVPGASPIAADAVFQVAFDTATPAEDAQLNRTLASAARFINMHGRAGVDPDNVHVAIVLHGRAVQDVTHPAEGEENPNEGLIAALLEQNVEIYVCGQSAAYYEVTAEDLLPGVTMSLSAMTAHAQLQQRGYTLNPF
ncbi:DsrE family protein [Hyphobacterium sp. HN65]|uniref:DsrE family protein n=1 Tax=Hyphobacterium lacteum TaxID=3116575 RepID=A0ABU7LP11_9PROT|nr:DsrE family protein [Hyphobacterium sp. HN65]MEE2525656.1 DsrE family protein [Hyphobacterium sp. HN65]